MMESFHQWLATSFVWRSDSPLLQLSSLIVLLKHSSRSLVAFRCPTNLSFDSNFLISCIVESRLLTSDGTVWLDHWSTRIASSQHYERLLVSTTTYDYCLETSQTSPLSNHQRMALLQQLIQIGFSQNDGVQEQQVHVGMLVAFRRLLHSWSAPLSVGWQGECWFLLVSPT